MDAVLMIVENMGIKQEHVLYNFKFQYSTAEGPKEKKEKRRKEKVS
jgi:hypothetical protein